MKQLGEDKARKRIALWDTLVKLTEHVNIITLFHEPRRDVNRRDSATKHHVSEGAFGACRKRPVGFCVFNCENCTKGNHITENGKNTFCGFQFNLDVNANTRKTHLLNNFLKNVNKRRGNVNTGYQYSERRALIAIEDTLAGILAFSIGQSSRMNFLFRQRIVFCAPWIH